MVANFWTANTVEPKRKFRFLMSITGKNQLDTVHSWYVKTAKKPSFKMEGQAEVRYIQHTWKYPGRIKWDAIDITIIDPATPDSAAIMLNMLAKSGYKAPKSSLAKYTQTSISKKNSIDAIGTLFLKQIDADGEVIEEWKLWNAFITGVDFGTVDYTSDDIVEYTINVDYDFATLNNRLSYPKVDADMST